MTEEITQIDIGALNSDINRLESDISRLEMDLNAKKEALELKKQLKLYINQYTVVNTNKKNNTIDLNTPAGLSQTEYVMFHLGKGGVDTSILIKSYSEYADIPYEDASGKISTTLNRLKKEGKIRNEANPGGRRFGSKWFKIIKNG